MASAINFPGRRMPGYIIVQLLDWQAFLTEIALTAGLLSAILGTTSAAQNVATTGALGVRGYIALAGLWAAWRRRRSAAPQWTRLDRSARRWPVATGPPTEWRRRPADRRGDRRRVRHHPARSRRGPDLPRCGLRRVDGGTPGTEGLAGAGHREGKRRAPPGSRRPAQTPTRNRRDSGLMRIISDEIDSFRKGEVLGSATALSRRAADRFVGLPIA